MAQNIAQQRELTALFAKYNIRIGMLYGSFIKKLSQLGYNVEDKLSENTLFLFDNFPELKHRLNDIFRQYVREQILLAQSGITSGVALAYGQDAKNLHGYTVLNDQAIDQVRNLAAKAFIDYRMNTQQGLNLSQRVWNYAEQTKSEFEMAMSNVVTDGLKHGTSAAELSRRVRDQLQEPDMMYRRYHHKVITAGGAAKDVVKWHKRIIDEEGRVRFIETPLEEVGQGVYRSSYKNTFRLMRSEINMSYHYANCERWQNEPFVLGIRIWGSPQHPEPDICDELWGDYPKDFMFSGFHPQCMCAASAITATRDEIREYHRRKRNGEDVSHFKFKGTVNDVPPQYKEYLEQHKEQIQRAGERGTLAYVFRDNPKYLGNIFDKEQLEDMGLQTKGKTPAEAAIWRHAQRDDAAAQQRWNEYQLQRAHKAIGNAHLNSSSPVLQTRLTALQNAVKSGNKDAIAAAYAEVWNGIHIQQLADARHAQRNDAAVQNVWDARRKQNALIFNTGRNVLAVADNLAFIDTAASAGLLRNLLLQYKLKEAKELTSTLAKQIADIKKQAAQLEYVENPLQHLKKATLVELQGVDEGVKYKISFLENKFGKTNYMKLAEKYNWEAYDYLGANMNGVQDKYPNTWKLSQAAYIKLSEKMQEMPKWQDLQLQLATLKAYTATSSKYWQEVADAEAAILAQKNLATAQAAVKLAEKHMKDLESQKKSYQKAQAKKAAMLADKELLAKAQKLGEETLKKHYDGKITLTGDELDIYDDIIFQAKTKKDAAQVKKLLAKLGIDADGNPAAVHVVPDKPVTLADIPKKEAQQLIDAFEKNFKDSADDLLRPIIKDVWLNKLTDEERLVLTKYTETYSYLNEPLREIHYSGWRTKDEFDNDMPILTSALSKMEMPENVVIRRGTSDYQIKALGKNLSQVNVGDEFVDGAFLSTAVRTDKGFFKSYNLVILVPKGAHGAYAEPFTFYNGGDAKGKDYSSGVNSSLNLWDGSHDASFGGEREWIGQRGSKFRVIKKTGSTIYLQLIGQYYEQTKNPGSYF